MASEAGDFVSKSWEARLGGCQGPGEKVWLRRKSGVNGRTLAITGPWREVRAA